MRMLPILCRQQRISQLFLFRTSESVFTPAMTRRSPISRTVDGTYLSRIVDRTCVQAARRKTRTAYANSNAHPLVHGTLVSGRAGQTRAKIVTQRGVQMSLLDGEPGLPI